MRYTNINILLDQYAIIGQNNEYILLVVKTTLFFLVSFKISILDDVSLRKHMDKKLNDIFK